MKNYSFGKKETLCSKLVIDKLFKNGKSIKVFPLRVVYLELEKSEETAKVLISVPKKRFNKAVSRNRLRRLIRETYRLNKLEVCEHWNAQGKYFALAFVYIGNEIADFRQMDNCMKQILLKLKSV
ncbi:ribonuclease P protein component [Bacteroidota bacterium]